MKRNTPEAIFGPDDGHAFDAGWTGAFLDIQLLSDLGKKRKNNEDSCLLYVPEAAAMLESRGFLVAVADGMGGASAGEYASHKALECICSKYYDKDQHTLIPSALRLAVESANEFVFEKADREAAYAGMGTTVSVLAVLGNWAYIAQVGDSRIYLLRKDQKIKQLTHDHSLVAEQIRNGLINEEEARNHSLKNLITRAVGIKETVEVDLFAIQLQQGDSLLLCSDGLSNMMEDDVIESYLGGEDLRKSSEQMVEHALDAGGHDNITVVTVRVHTTPPPSNYQQGAKVMSYESPGLLRRLRRMFIPM